MRAFTFFEDVVDLIKEFGGLYSPLGLFRKRFRTGGELVFGYNSNVELGDVLEAFEKFYYEYNSWGGCKTVHRKHDSDGAAFLLAASGFRPQWMLVGFSNCGDGRCTVGFLAMGNSRKWTENGREQVKKFFTEEASSLLKLERWGESLQEARGEGGAQESGGVVARIQRKRPLEGGAVGAPEKFSTPAVRACMVCSLGFQDGDLLAWCPFCGAAAHRLHLLEYLHVKENCPACGRHLDEGDLGAQLGRANLRLPARGRK